MGRTRKASPLGCRGAARRVGFGMVRGAECAVVLAAEGPPVMALGKSTSRGVGIKAPLAFGRPDHRRQKVEVLVHRGRMGRKAVLEVPLQ